MVINWYGESCFKVQIGPVALLIDPVKSGTGLTAPRFKADVVLKTESPFPLPSFFEEKHEEVAEVVGPGEYELKGIRVIGVAASRDGSPNSFKTMYAVEADGMRIGFFGKITKSPESAELEHFVNVDIAVLPAGGNPFLDQDEAAKLVKQVDPKIVIPSLYRIPGLKRKADDVKDFLAVMGSSRSEEAQEKLTIKKAELPPALRVVPLRV